MRRNALFAAVLAVSAALAPAWAPGAAGAAEPAAQEAPDQSVALAAVALPLVFDGQLVNYVFVRVKLLLTPTADAMALRDKEPFFRDALVRAAHRTPFVRTGDYNHLDVAKLEAAAYREAVAIAGPGKIASVVVLSQTPKHRISSQPPGAGAAIIP